MYLGKDPIIKASFVNPRTREYHEIKHYPIIDESQKINLHHLPDSLPKNLLKWADGKSLTWLKHNRKTKGYSLKEVMAAYHWERMMRKLPRDKWKDKKVQVQLWIKAREMSR
jgi:hypothetical protein